MGKKSKIKKEKHKQQQEIEKKENFQEQNKSGLERFLLQAIRFGVYFSLLTPLVLSSKFYFPFVGPKSLYFMACAEIVFFVWLTLALNYKQYRPKINLLLIVFVLFLITLTLSAVFGVDFSRSFWSKYERMTGLLMWFHLFGFFLAISSVFRKLSDWKKVFFVSVLISILIASFSLLERAGVQALKFSNQGGSTLGNTSFLGTYLLFNLFLALYLFWQERNKLIKILLVACIILYGFAIYFAGARAAILAVIGGLGLIILLFLSFKPKRKEIVILGKVLLGISTIVVLLAIILLYLPNNPVSDKFIALTTKSRMVNWEMAWKGFLEKPLFGWGPETYDILFTKFFNPCLFTPACGGEIWFDRTHNIILDTLSMTGIFGFLTYLALFAALFYILGKHYFKEKSIDFWTFSIFIALPVAYFIQNLTVFDMPASLMMFVLILGFGAFLANRSKDANVETKFLLRHRWLIACLMLVFCFTFFNFVVQPLRSDNLVIQALQAQSSSERIKLYQKTLDASSLGKYQIRDFFAQHSQEVLMQDIKSLPAEEVKKELNFLAVELEKSEKESSLDFRSILKLAQIYNIYSLIEPQKLSLAEKYAQEARNLSPTNQQTYWTLAQTNLYKDDFKAALSLAETAIVLEPKWLRSYEIAIQIAQLVGNQEKAKEIIQKAIAVNPEWEKQLLGGLDK